MAETKSLLIGIFVALIVGSGVTYMINDNEIPDGYSAHYCEDTNVVGLCWKLSSTNISCYWNMSAPRRSKRCTTLWQPFELSEAEGKEVIIPDEYTTLFDIPTRKDVSDIEYNYCKTYAEFEVTEYLDSGKTVTLKNGTVDHIYVNTTYLQKGCVESANILRDNDVIIDIDRLHAKVSQKVESKESEICIVDMDDSDRDLKCEPGESYCIRFDNTLKCFGQNGQALKRKLLHNGFTTGVAQ